MPDWSLYNDNAQTPAVETRNNLAALATLIVARKHDLTNPDYDKLVTDLHETIKELQNSYKSCHIKEYY